MAHYAALQPQPIPIPGSSTSSTSPPASFAEPISSSTSPPASFAEPISSPTHRRKSATSPPIDPSKLNNLPAPLPTQAESLSPKNEPRSPPLRTRSSSNPMSPPTDSAYLDNVPHEPASHPTIAETGVPSGNGETGPRSGQLRRVEKKEGTGDIIKLGSLGGDGLKVKPPVGMEED